MDLNTELIHSVNVDSVMPFPCHPFLIRDDEQMAGLTQSIRQFGVLSPVIVRQLKDGTFQLISGHRRLHACLAVGIGTIPALIRNVDFDTATIMMVDSNIQREDLLPSEKAHAYKMKLDAMKRQGFRSDLTSVQVEQKLKRKTARDIIAETAPDSSAQIWRFIRLNELIPQLLEMVDRKQIALSPAVELSYLRTHEQQWLLQAIETDIVTPSLSQALRMKKLSTEGKLTEDTVSGIMTEQKKSDSWNLALPMNRLAQYFPADCSSYKMQEIIFRLLDKWIEARKRRKT